MRLERKQLRKMMYKHNDMNNSHRSSFKDTVASINNSSSNDKASLSQDHCHIIVAVTLTVVCLSVVMCQSVSAYEYSHQNYVDHYRSHEPSTSIRVNTRTSPHARSSSSEPEDSDVDEENYTTGDSETGVVYSLPDARRHLLRSYSQRMLNRQQLHDLAHLAQIEARVPFAASLTSHARYYRAHPTRTVRPHEQIDSEESELAQIPLPLNGNSHSGDSFEPHVLNQREQREQSTTDESSHEQYEGEPVTTEVTPTSMSSFMSTNTSSSTATDTPSHARSQSVYFDDSLDTERPSGDVHDAWRARSKAHSNHSRRPLHHRAASQSDRANNRWAKRQHSSKRDNEASADEVDDDTAARQPHVVELPRIEFMRFGSSGYDAVGASDDLTTRGESKSTVGDTVSPTPLAPHLVPGAIARALASAAGTTPSGLAPADNPLHAGKFIID